MDKDEFMRCSSLAVGLIALLTSFASAAEDTSRPVALRRWAILATEEVRKSGVSDLVFDRLAKEADLKLVEREQLDAVLRELTTSSLAGSREVSRRLQVGRQLKADALLVLSVIKARPAGANEPSLQIVICDCHSGARLLMDFPLWQPRQPEEMVQSCVQAIRDARRRYAAGSMRLIGVGPFVVKGLPTPHDHLQTTLATLLERSLLRVPGLAVVEVDEAIAIEREHRLPGRPLDASLVPLFIEGELEVLNRDQQEAPKFRLAMRCLDGTGVRFAEQPPELTLEQMTKLVETEFVPRWIVHESKRADGVTATRAEIAEVDAPRRRVELLTSQARRFARAGLGQTATSLGEAALLVAPEDHAVRVTLVQHYIQWQNIEADRKWTLEEIPSQLRSQQLRLDRARLHLETVLRNQWLNPDGGSRLLNVFLRNRWDNVFAHPAGYRPDPRPWWEMYWELVSLVAKLDAETPDRYGPGDPGFPPGHPERSRRQWGKFGQWTFSLLTETALTNERQRKTPAAETRVFEFAERYFREFAPADEPMWGVVAWLIRPEGVQGALLNGELLAEDLDRFLNRVAAIDKPSAKRYATLGRIALAIRHRNTDRLTEWQTELARMHDEPWAKQSPSLLRMLEADLNSLTPTTARKRHVLPRNPSPPFVTRPSVAFRPLPDIVKSPEWVEWRACGADWDLLWSKSSVGVMRQRGRLEPFFTPLKSEGVIVDVAWDEEHVWIATERGGVRAISPRGEVVCHIDDSTGLPKWGSAFPPQHWLVFSGAALGRNVRVHPIRAGQCVVTGSTRQPQQQWVAVLTLNDGEARREGRCRCDVVHVSKADPPTSPQAAVPLDARFVPSWFLTLSPRAAESPLVLIGRGGGQPLPRQPLVIDSGSMKASIGPIGLMEKDYATQAKSGHVVIVDAETIEVWQPPLAGDPLAWKRTAQVEDRINVPRPALPPLRVGDEALIPGPRWHRVTKTGELIALSESPLLWQSRHSHYGTSAHFGVVAWNAYDRAYQVLVSPTVEQAAEAAIQFPHVPAEHLARHAAAVALLRSRGATVDALWGEPAHKLSMLAGTGGSSYGDRRRWHTFVFLGPEWTGSTADLQRLADLHDLSGVYAVRAKLTDTDMSAFTPLTRLGALALVETAVTDAGLEHLRGLDKLEYLRLEGTLGGHEFSSRGLSPLQGLKSLSELLLVGPGFRDDALPTLEKLPSLIHLWAVDTSLSPAKISRLVNATNSKPIRVSDRLQQRPDLPTKSRGVP